MNDALLRDIIFDSITKSARTPSLHTIRAMLLYMDLPLVLVREPDHPGFWALANQASLISSFMILSQRLTGLKLVGLAQEVGLHIDPIDWNMSSLSEKHSRRILWWAVYMHDKWYAVRTECMVRF